MVAQNERGFRYICYGDDTRLVYRDRDGQLWICDPDFKQMDGSVDKETVHAVVDYVYETLEEKYGENNFWKQVCELWKYFAVSPDFIVDGTTVYRKKVESGLMTGVTGTTLFDTAKAVLSWEVAVAHFMDGRVDPFDGNAVKAFMKKKCGLEVKDGTWRWDKVPMRPLAPGTLITDHKFLGMQVRCDEWQDEEVFVPVIPTEDWRTILLTPRQDPERPEKSTLAKNRSQFDSLRGWAATGANFDPEIRAVLNHLANETPALAILMQTQLEGGMAPEGVLLSGRGADGFRFPDSYSWPTVEYTYSLYSSQPTDPTLCKPLFPGMVEFSAMLRQEKKERLVVGKTSSGRKEISIALVDPPDHDEPKVFEVINTPKKPVPLKAPIPAPRDRSKIAKVSAEGIQTTSKSLKVQPDVTQVVETLSQQPVRVADVMKSTGYTAKRIQKVLPDTSAFVLQEDPQASELRVGDVLVKDPPVQFADTFNAKMQKKREAKRGIVDKYTYNRLRALKALKGAPVSRFEASAVVLDSYVERFNSVNLPRVSPPYDLTLIMNNIAINNMVPYKVKTVSSKSVVQNGLDQNGKPSFISKAQVTVEMLSCSKFGGSGAPEFDQVVGSCVAPSAAAARSEMLAVLFTKLNSRFGGKLDYLLPPSDFSYNSLPLQDVINQAEGMENWYEAAVTEEQAIKKAPESPEAALEALEQGLALRRQWCEALGDALEDLVARGEWDPRWGDPVSTIANSPMTLKCIDAYVNSGLEPYGPDGKAFSSPMLRLLEVCLGSRVRKTTPFARVEAPKTTVAEKLLLSLPEKREFVELSASEDSEGSELDWDSSDVEFGANSPEFFKEVLDQVPPTGGARPMTRRESRNARDRERKRKRDARVRDEVWRRREAGLCASDEELTPRQIQSRKQAEKRRAKKGLPPLEQLPGVSVEPKKVPPPQVPQTEVSRKSIGVPVLSPSHSSLFERILTLDPQFEIPERIMTPFNGETAGELAQRRSWFLHKSLRMATSDAKARLSQSPKTKTFNSRDKSNKNGSFIHAETKQIAKEFDETRPSKAGRSFGRREFGRRDERPQFKRGVSSRGRSRGQAR
nr:MAG: RNA-dependent RNA polymerase [Wufeng shrew permutotetravirus 15]